MSTTKGLYVQRLDNGEIHGVQVKDSAGNDRSVTPDVYVARGYEPPLESLPNIADYKQ